MAYSRHQLGARAEDAAARWLVAGGWAVLERRWRIAEGELDLVCREPLGTLVGVEVRARTGRRTGSALESIDPWRVARLRRALAAYAAASGERGELRLDLVTAELVSGGWRLSRLAAIDGW
jgi:putative endonuclease